MSSGVTSLCLHPGQFMQSGLCRGRRALVGLLSAACKVWLRQRQDQCLPQASCGVATRLRTHPLAEPSHGGGQPSRVSGELSLKYHGEQLDEGSLGQPHTTYGRGDLTSSLSWSPLSPPMKWRQGRCGVTRRFLEALTPICVCSLV